MFAWAFEKPAERVVLARALELARQADAKDPPLENWRQRLEQLGR